MIFKQNLVLKTYFIEYQFFTLRGDPLRVYPGLKKQFYVKHKFGFYYLLKILCSFSSKNTFNNTGKKHIIHFMGLPVVFFSKGPIFIVFTMFYRIQRNLDFEILGMRILGLNTRSQQILSNTVYRIKNPRDLPIVLRKLFYEILKSFFDT